MTVIDCWIDFISPYAYLAFERLPHALQGLSYRVRYRPVLFAGLLAQHGQLGPAEIAPKRDWTYRQVAWLAQQHGVPLVLPAQHPFNPLALLRLALACPAHGAPNRYVCETIFRHVWAEGGDATDPARLAALRERLQPAHDPDAPAIKQALREHTEAALAAGVFGVPTFGVEGRLFWGLDALPMLRAQLAGGAERAALDQAWAAPEGVATGVRRGRPV